MVSTATCDNSRSGDGNASETISSSPVLSVGSVSGKNGSIVMRNFKGKAKPSEWSITLN